MDKGVPLGYSLVGSAASVLEAVGSGSLRVENISPSLPGGFVLTVGVDHPWVKQIPVPERMRAFTVHAHLFLCSPYVAHSTTASSM